MTGGRLPALQVSRAVPASALVVAIGLVLIIPFVSLGHLSSHMLMHIVTMSIAAPLLATAWASLERRSISTHELWAATVTQIMILWGWHFPAAHHVASSSTLGAVVMHASLLGSALWFWLCLIRLRLPQQWQGILALMITAKLSCLLAGLLVFATRPIFAHHHHDGALDDQQLAGLLMIVACPASYVLAGIMVAVQVVGVVQPLQARSE